MNVCTAPKFVDPFSSHVEYTHNEEKVTFENQKSVYLGMPYIQTFTKNTVVCISQHNRYCIWNSLCRRYFDDAKLSPYLESWANLTSRIDSQISNTRSMSKIVNFSVYHSLCHMWQFTMIFAETVSICNNFKQNSRVNEWSFSEHDQSTYADMHFENR